MFKLINYAIIMQYSLRFNFSYRAESKIGLCSFRRNAFNAYLSCMYLKFRGMHTSPSQSGVPLAQQAGEFLAVPSWSMYFTEECGLISFNS